MKKSLLTRSRIDETIMLQSSPLDSGHRQLHDISRPLKSILTVSVQFFRSLPLLFLNSGTQCNRAYLVGSSVLVHAPSHRSRLLLMMFSISSCPVLSLM